MTLKDFLKYYLPFAKETDTKTGISALAILAQAALESGWGEVAPGNMIFGLKDFDGINGNEQLLTTTEYSTRMDLKFPVILSVKPVIRNGRKTFKYRVKDYFRKYDTPEESFTDHANFLIRNPRYAKAMEVKEHPFAFIDEIAKAGYATDPSYAKTLHNILSMLQKNL